MSTVGGITSLAIPSELWCRVFLFAYDSEMNYSKVSYAAPMPGGFRLISKRFTEGLDLWALEGMMERGGKLGVHRRRLDCLLKSLEESKRGEILRTNRLETGPSGWILQLPKVVPRNHTSLQPSLAEASNPRIDVGSARGACFSPTH
jgi:hypothetical protein